MFGQSHVRMDIMWQVPNIRSLEPAWSGQNLRPWTEGRHDLRKDHRDQTWLDNLRTKWAPRGYHRTTIELFFADVPAMARIASRSPQFTLDMMRKSWSFNSHMGIPLSRNASEVHPGEVPEAQRQWSGHCLWQHLSCDETCNPCEKIQY